MRVYFSGVENSPYLWDMMGDVMMSYLPIRKRENFAMWMDIDRLREFMVDSGAFSWIMGKKGRNKAERTDLDVVEYTHTYCKWLAQHRKSIDYYVELDIDEVVGWEKQLELRGIFESYNLDPCMVWHKSNKLTWDEHCSKYEWVGITPRENTMTQMRSKLGVADRHGCQVHIFQFTAPQVRNLKMFKSFFSCDSTSWLSGSKYGSVYFWKESTKSLVVYSEQEIYRRHGIDYLSLSYADKQKFVASQWVKAVNYWKEEDVETKQVKLEELEVLT